MRIQRISISQINILKVTGIIRNLNLICPWCDKLHNAKTVQMLTNKN